MSSWRDNIAEDRFDWEYLGEREYRVAAMAAARLGSNDSDPMVDHDDHYQDALFYMASHRKAVEGFTATSQLVRHVVARLLRYANEDRTAAGVTNRSFDAGSMDND